MHGYTFSLLAERTTGKKVGLFLFVCSSEHDDSLLWPIEMTYHFELKNPQKDMDHISHTIDSTKQGNCWQKPVGGDNTGFGIATFATPEELKKYTDGEGYVTFTVAIQMNKPWRFQYLIEFHAFTSNFHLERSVFVVVHRLEILGVLIFLRRQSYAWAQRPLVLLSLPSMCFLR